MMKTLLTSLREAIAAFRANFFHTFLSMLGIVIGVGALVGTLSVIDGLEEHANRQISATTSLQMMTVQVQQSRWVDGVSVRYDTTLRFNETDVAAIQDELGSEATVLGRSLSQSIIEVIDDTVTTAAYVGATTWPPRADTVALLAGRRLRAADAADRRKVIVVNKTLADKLREETRAAEVIGVALSFFRDTFTIVGVEATTIALEPPAAIVPIRSLAPETREALELNISVKAPTVEAIPDLQERIQTALRARHPGKEERIQISYNQLRVEQMARGFMLFRLVMGFIVGLSVLVGGIGVMNVLLISVTERTREIGLRKAMGARRRDIVLQFLVESITIASVGNLCGLLLGMLATLGGVPLIRYFVEVEFPVVFSLGTLLTVVVVALFIGILFGTYPAVKAAGLDPVDAIRRE